METKVEKVKFIKRRVLETKPVSRNFGVSPKTNSKTLPRPGLTAWAVRKHGQNVTFGADQNMLKSIVCRKQTLVTFSVKPLWVGELKLT